MAMFSFDEQAALFDVTPLPNQFILNYLPEASGDAVRVYLFGLVACYHHEAISDLQQMARELNMTEDDIRAAYRYWERKGLVQRVADNPPQYRYQNIYQVMMTGAQAQIDPAYEQFAEAIASFSGARKSLAEQIEATTAVLDAAKKESAEQAVKAVTKKSLAPSSASTLRKRA